jgi:hypothetical protein
MTRPVPPSSPTCVMLQAAEARSAPARLEALRGLLAGQRALEAALQQVGTDCAPWAALYGAGCCCSTGQAWYQVCM